jgi:hypothetical protein
MAFIRLADFLFPMEGFPYKGIILSSGLGVLLVGSREGQRTYEDNHCQALALKGKEDSFLGIKQLELGERLS